MTKIEKQISILAQQVSSLGKQNKTLSASTFSWFRLLDPDFCFLSRKESCVNLRSGRLYLFNEIENENINNRDDIIQSLQDIGFEIPRQGKILASSAL
jgi:hypothetical protein